MYRYTEASVAGPAQFEDIKYVDIECNIEAVEGRVTITRSDQWYYNFTYDVDTSSAGPVLSRMEIDATLNNNTHFPYHKCAVQPAWGHARQP